MEWFNQDCYNLGMSGSLFQEFSSKTRQMSIVISLNDLAMQFMPGHISIEVKRCSRRNSGPNPKICMCLLNDNIFATIERCKLMHSYVARHEC